MIRRYLIDTNHMAAAIEPVSRLRERILRGHRNGERFGTCIPVLLELEAGIIFTAEPERNHQRRDHLLQIVRLWPVDLSIVSQFGEITAELKSRGRVLSHVDMILATLTRRMNITILTTDRDFEALPDVRTENWVTEESP